MNAIKDFGMILLSLVVLAGFYFISYLIITGQTSSLDPELAMLIGTVFGAVASQSGSVITYWFGSSAGSAAKDKTISDTMKTGTGAGTTTTNATPQG